MGFPCNSHVLDARFRLGLKSSGSVRQTETVARCPVDAKLWEFSFTTARSSEAQVGLRRLQHNKRGLIDK